MIADVFCWYCYGNGSLNVGKGVEPCEECVGTGRNALPWSELFINGRTRVRSRGPEPRTRTGK